MHFLDLKPRIEKQFFHMSHVLTSLDFIGLNSKKYKWVSKQHHASWALPNTSLTLKNFESPSHELHYTKKLSKLKDPL